MSDEEQQQLLEIMEDHLSGGKMQVYDPYVKTDMVSNQHHDLNAFLNAVDMVVVMVGHNEILANADILKNKIVFDTRHVLIQEGIYHL